MKTYSWSAQSAISAGMETPAAIGSKYVRMLDGLSRIDPALSGWTLWQGRATLDDLLAWADAGGEEPAPIAGVGLDDVRRDPAAFVEANVHLDDWGEPQPDEGYSLVANNQFNQTPRNVCVSVSAGAAFSCNRWSATFGQLGPGLPNLVDPSIITFPIVGGLFRALTSLWPTPWAMVRGSAVEYEDRPGVIGRTSVETSRHDITWMGYLSAKTAPGFRPPPELISEPTADGGVLMMSDEERPDPADPDQMRRSDLLGSIMDQHLPRA
jgi:hypothetical protein